MMPNAIASEIETPPRWNRHLIVLAVLAGLAAAISLLLWLHPTLGYMRGGYLDGADLRSDLIQLLWWSALAFGAASTATLGWFSSRLRGRIRHAITYGAGALAVALILPILDRYY
jgi:hypothetical protein